MISKKILSGLVILVIIFGFAAAPLFAGDKDRIGTAAGVQVQIPVGARDMALGGADLANTSGLNAQFWNPAGMPRMDRVVAAQFSYMSIFNDIGVNYLAVGYNDEDLGSFGLNIKSLGFGDIPFTTNEDMDGASGRTFSPTFVTVGLSYARVLTEYVNVGLTVKVINETIDRASASAVAFDIGLQYTNPGGVEGVNFGVAIKNIGTNLTYEGSGLGSNYLDPNGKEFFLNTPAASNELPTSIELGLSYTGRVNEDNSVLVTSKFQSNNFQNDALQLGVEYNYTDFLFARGGYNYGLEVDSEDQLYDFALGAGIKTQLGDVAFVFDYAYRNSRYFDGSNVFTFELYF
jgi:outer membrane protein W